MKKKLKAIMEFFLPILVAVVIAQVLTKVVFVNAVIPSESMESTIMKGDRIFANRLAYINSEPERNDIVVFNATVEDKLYIKRIIGLPGEKVEILDGKIYINDSSVPLEEPYLPEDWIIANDGLVYEVPEGHYFMLGDNRNFSSDSRMWASVAISQGLAATQEEAEKFQFVPEEDILGKAVFRYWPLKDIKMY